jgi:hypothetical protein
MTQEKVPIDYRFSPKLVVACGVMCKKTGT